jgi:hypothetical protein
MRIWLALLIAPVLMLADQSVAFAATGWACAHQNGIAMHAIHFLFLAAATVSALAAAGQWRSTANPAPGDSAAVRRHFVAGLATASASFSALVIAAMWYPNWLLSPCVV